MPATGGRAPWGGPNPPLFVAIAWVLLVAGCGGVRDQANAPFRPTQEGFLTVATELPAPGFWDGEAPEEVERGFEYRLAQRLAEELEVGLRVVEVPFSDLVEGDLDGADLALAQMAVTDERAGRVEFSRPYLTTAPAVLARPGDEVLDLAAARELDWAVEAATTEADFLDEVVRPEGTTATVDSFSAAVAAVEDGAADAALVDLQSALAVAATSGLEVVATFDEVSEIAGALPLGSPNVEPIDAVLSSLDADGTLARLEATELDDRFGRPADLPVIPTR